MPQDYSLPPRTTSLIDMVFPGDTNHHGVLFGGTGLAHMDKVAFIAAVRHGHVSFVTASCERVDFAAPAKLGHLVEATGQVVRVGRTSMSVQVDLVSEDLLTGARTLCTRGLFNMVAVKPKNPNDAPVVLPPLASEPIEALQDPSAPVRMVELVFPDHTNPQGLMQGGVALDKMGKAAFVAASRHCRRIVVMASSRQIDFESAVRLGDVIELIAQVRQVGRTSMTVRVEMWAEGVKEGERRRCAVGEFVMVAVDSDEKPVRVPPIN